MTLARWQRTIVSGGGVIVPGASVEVRRESDNGLASLFSDRAGTVGIANPFVADSQGFAAFHVVGGAYKIVATFGSSTLTWRYVGVGMTQEFDVDQLSLTYASVPDVPDGNVVGRPLGAGTGDPQALTSAQQFANAAASGSSLWGPGRSLSISTTPVTMSASDSGKHVLSGNATRTVHLPTPANGICYSFSHFGTGSLTIDTPNGGILIYPNNTSNSSITIAADGRGAEVLIFCDGTNWLVFGSTVTGTNVLATTSQEGAVQYATAAQYRANTPLRGLDNNDVWSAADIVPLTDAVTVLVDFSAGLNFSVTLGGNRTLGNPSNTKNGQSGVITVTQDGTGSRTLAYGGNYKFAGGVAPILSTGIGQRDALYYFVLNSTNVVITGVVKNF